MRVSGNDNMSSSEQKDNTNLTSGMHDLDLEEIEISLLLDAIQKRHGYDFHQYAKASLSRRIKNRLVLEGLDCISEMIPRILRDNLFFDRFLLEMSVTVTQMFRNPIVFKTIRDELFPKLKTYSRIKIWHAGCATGEEAYSMAIMLAEAGLLDRTQIYATDFNNNSLEIAKKGIYPVEDVTDWSSDYIEAGGVGSFSDYYHAKYDSMKISKEIMESVTFAHHNLMRDQAFGEMNVIVCRNVLIYFEKDLQNKVLTMMRESLVHRGYLVLGDRESLDFTDVSKDFKEVHKKTRVYQKEASAGFSRTH